MNVLAAAMVIRNSAETLVPITPPISLKCSNLPCSEVTAKASAMEAAITTVECPSEKKKPAEIGRFPLCISFRVTLSMAAM